MIRKHWWKEAARRWRAKSPDFFNKIRPWAVGITTLATVGEVAIYYMESKGLYIPDVAKYICTGIVGLGMGAGIVAKLPVHPAENGLNDQKDHHE